MFSVVGSEVHRRCALHYSYKCLVHGLDMKIAIKIGPIKAIKVNQSKFISTNPLCFTEVICRLDNEAR